MKSVYIYPDFPDGAIGGVAQHIRMLRRHLPAYGWTLARHPDDADLVHVHAAERAPQVDVYTNHGIHPVRPNMPMWQRQQNQAIFDNLKWTREVIAVSHWTAAQWTHLTGIKPHIIYNAVDPKEWSTGVLSYRERARYDLQAGGRPVLLWGKNVLSDVCDPTPAIELALRFPDVVVAMTADPRLIPNPPANVRLLGRLPYERMQGLIAESDVYLATTLENHSVQVVEAMFRGAPVLGYAWGGTAETVQDGVEGRLVRAGDLDALSDALTDVLANRKTYGKAAKARAANFTAAGMAQQTAAVYDRAYAEKTREASADNPICSIVIPVYNKAAYVRETLESAIGQQHPAFEVIVVDDGSTDGSRKVVEDVLGAYSGKAQARLIAKPNSGVADSRNVGIAAARGRYICCLDADDRIAPQFLTRLSAALDADPGLGIAYPDMLVFGHDASRGAWSTTLAGSEYDFRQLVKGNFIPCCNLFRRKAWERAGGYRDINPSWEDYELWLRMGKLGWHGQRVPGALFHYRKVAQQGRDHESQGWEWKLRATVNRLHRDLYSPTVSVVIPCYGHSQFLAEALDSVMAQTYPDFEVVVVDDGNEPAEAAAIAAITGRYSPDDVQLIVHGENRGLAAARNTAIAAARGKWIVPLDADDKIAPTFLERTLRAVGGDASLFAYTDSWLWFPDGENRLLQAEEYDFTNLLIRLTWPCTVLYAKDAWEKAGGYKLAMSEAGGWEDWEFAIALGEAGICGKHVSEPLFYYRQHSDTQMRHGALSVKPRLQEMLRRLHAAVYRGERPMGCCGGAARPAPGAPTQQSVEQLAAVANDKGLLVVKYTGNSAGTRTWRTPGGGSYLFSMFEPYQQMPPADAAYFEQLPDFTVIR